jgi:hypothetical protein
VLTLEKEKEKKNLDFSTQYDSLQVFKFICVVEGKGVDL